MRNLIIFIILILSHISYGHGYVGYNYDSQSGISDSVAGFITITFLLFILYVIIRVRKELKNEK